MVPCGRVEKFEIVKLRKGAMSLRSLDFNETFHPVTGPRFEANLLHVEQQRLVERASACEKFIVWDVGFGAAANAVVALEALSQVDRPVEIHSFDRSMDPIAFALENAEALEYLLPHRARIAELLENGVTSFGTQGVWKFHAGDFRDTVSLADIPAPHALIYDPYSPVGNPDMWNLEHFTRLRARLTEPCLFSNYTRSTAVRVTLLLAGFYVGVGRAVGDKAETSVASNCLEMIEKPLGEFFLKRCLESHNSAPMKQMVYVQSKISDEDYAALLKHPQFRGDK